MTRAAEALVATVGRTDLRAFFTKSGMFGKKGGWPHHPALAFIVQGPMVTVRICSNLEQVLRLEDEVLVMQQWPGQYRSDFFTYSVGELRNHLENVLEGGA